MSRDWHDPQVDALLERLGLTADNPRELLNLPEGQFSEALAEAVLQASAAVAPDVRDGLRRDAADMRQRRRAARASFEQELHVIWQETLDELQALIEAARDSGELFHERVGADAAADEDITYAVLLRLHARGCRMAEESFVLLQAGFGQAAMARWRSLHELTVCGMFIYRYGDRAAQPYLDHDAVVSLAAMNEHEKLRVDGRLHGEPLIDADEREHLEQVVASLREQYGRSFMRAYGWAAPALRVTRPNIEPNFADIENEVELDQLRPWYRMANHAVHGGPKGITWTPDLSAHRQGDSLLAGPGFDGLADPAECVAISLVQATINLLMLSPGLDDILVMRTLLLMSEDVANAGLVCERDSTARSRTAPSNRQHHRRRDPRSQRSTAPRSAYQASAGPLTELVPFSTCTAAPCEQTLVQHLRGRAR